MQSDLFNPTHASITICPIASSRSRWTCASRAATARPTATWASTSASTPSHPRAPARSSGVLRLEVKPPDCGALPIPRGHDRRLHRAQRHEHNDVLTEWRVRVWSYGEGCRESASKTPGGVAQRGVEARGQAGAVQRREVDTRVRGRPLTLSGPSMAGRRPVLSASRRGEGGCGRRSWPGRRASPSATPR